MGFEFVIALVAGFVGYCYGRTAERTRWLERFQMGGGTLSLKQTTEEK